MARKFLVPIDLNVNELQNAVIQNLVADPVSGNTDGRIYYNTASDKLRVYANNSWIDVGAITSIQGTTNEIEVSIVDGVATIGLPATIYANVVGDVTGNASTSTKLATARNIALGGDLSGTASFDGSSDVTITATIGANSVALGTDTTGDYVAGVTASDGISSTGTGEGASVALTNTDKGSSQNIFKNVSDGTTSIVADNNDDTITFTAGTGISVSANATTDTMTIGNTGVTSIAGTANQIAVSGSTGSVTVSLPNAVTFPGSVTLNADPTQALHAVTKQYVDGIVSGLDWHPAVHLLAATNVALTGATETLVIDGHDALDSTDNNVYRILLKNQTTGSENGIYLYTDNGTTYTLVRASDADTYGELVGASVFIMEGTTYGKTSWVQSNHYLTDFSGQVWNQFSGSGTYVGGNGIDLTGNSFSIDTDVVVDINSIQTLTNKTLTSPTITNPSVSGLYISDNTIVIEGTTDAFETTVNFTDPTADRTITFKDESGTVAFTADITSAINALTTSDIEEGTNLYFTDERAQDAVAGITSGSNSLSVTYTDSSNTLALDTILKSVDSYMTKTSGLAVDLSTLEPKLVTDGFTKKYVGTMTGDATKTVWDLAHGLSTDQVTVTVYDIGTVSTPAIATQVECDVTVDSTNVHVGFATAPATNKKYRVVVVG